MMTSRQSFLTAVFSAVIAILPHSPAVAGPADGLSRQVFVGYQGWYGCPGDFEGNKDWQYWFPKDKSAAGFIGDVLPSVRSMAPAHLCDTGLPRADGQGTIKLFSSQDPVVVTTHFQWLAQAGIDGAAVQRFVFALDDASKKSRMDHLLANVMSASAKTGRSFFVVYDITGASEKTVTAQVRADWKHLVDDLHITKAPGYLHDNGKPVLELWGFGLGDRPGSASDVGSLVSELETGAGGLRPVTLIGGVPTYWRTLSKDSKTDPAWAQVYRSFDVISPWPVGRYATAAEFDAFRRDLLEPDIAEAHRAGRRYLPVAFPGYSHSNAARFHGRTVPFNGTPRDCGRFFWHQLAGISKLHAEGLYVAMFDEVGEGTAIFPIETHSDRVLAGSTVVVANQDGCSLPDDWYLRVTGAASGFVHDRQAAPDSIERVIHP